jgi:hypothetical protein
MVALLMAVVAAAKTRDVLSPHNQPPMVRGRTRHSPCHSHTKIDGEATCHTADRNRQHLAIWIVNLLSIQSPLPRTVKADRADWFEHEPTLSLAGRNRVRILPGWNINADSASRSGRYVEIQRWGMHVLVAFPRPSQVMSRLPSSRGVDRSIDIPSEFFFF